MNYTGDRYKEDVHGDCPFCDGIASTYECESCGRS